MTCSPGGRQPPGPGQHQDVAQGAVAVTPRLLKISLSGLALQPPVLDGDTPAIGTRAERDIASLILRGAILARRHDDREAIAALQAAAAQATGTRLRDAVGSTAREIAHRLVWAGPGNTSAPTPDGLEAAQLATRMCPDLTSDWQDYGAALLAADRAEDALAAHDRTIALDPRDGYAYNGRAAALQALGRHEDALAACEQGVALNPGNSMQQHNRGATLKALLDEDALAAFDQAIALDPRNGYAYRAKASDAAGPWPSRRRAHRGQPGRPPPS